MSLYRTFTVEELATDETFRLWVMNPTPELDHYWQQWLLDNPDRTGVVGRARELVLAIHELYKNDLSEDTVSYEINEITRRAEDSKSTPSYRIGNGRTVWRAAAAVMLTAGLGWLYYTSRPVHTEAGKPSVATNSRTEILVRVNNTDGELTVLLSDNSVATLSKGSSITYPRQFAASERKIHLTGEAFFDVAKNPSQPFLVYTDETVTKVLGTSFRVKAFDDEGTVMVAVKTGRVSVYPKKEYEMQNGRAHVKLTGVVLDPNQQAVFNRKDNRLEKGVVANPGILTESAIHKEQVFDDKPVAEVFNALAKTYGISITYNAESLSNCMVSAQFNDENLKQRLNAICQAIGAGYDMEDGRVVISSKGCN